MPTPTQAPNAFNFNALIDRVETIENKPAPEASVVDETRLAIIEKWVSDFKPIYDANAAALEARLNALETKPAPAAPKGK